MNPSENLPSQKNLPRPITSTQRVLLVAYYFPPLGMGGTQRVAY